MNDEIAKFVGNFRISPEAAARMDAGREKFVDWARMTKYPRVTYPHFLTHEQSHDERRERRP